jgi:hypothetical protein
LSKLRKGVKGIMLARMLAGQTGATQSAGDDNELRLEPEPEPEIEDPNACLLQFEYDAFTLHIGGLGGEYEDEEVLRNVFAPYGRFIQATVRQRPGINQSWALVSFADRECLMPWAHPTERRGLLN